GRGTRRLAVVHARRSWSAPAGRGTRRLAGGARPPVVERDSWPWSAPASRGARPPIRSRPLAGQHQEAVPGHRNGGAVPAAEGALDGEARGAEEDPELAEGVEAEGEGDRTGAAAAHVGAAIDEAARDGIEGVAVDHEVVALVEDRDGQDVAHDPVAVAH